jgi:hypothetical protein
MSAPVDTPRAVEISDAAVESYLGRLSRRARKRLGMRAQQWADFEREVPTDIPEPLQGAVAVFLVAGLAILLGLMSTIMLPNMIGLTWSGAWLAVLLVAAGRAHRAVMRLYVKEHCDGVRMLTCPVCEYDQRGTSNSDCPECGCPVGVAIEAAP